MVLEHLFGATTSGRKEKKKSTDTYAASAKRNGKMSKPDTLQTTSGNYIAKMTDKELKSVAHWCAACERAFKHLKEALEKIKIEAS